MPTCMLGFPTLMMLYRRICYVLCHFIVKKSRPSPDYDWFSNIFKYALFHKTQRYDFIILILWYFQSNRTNGQHIHSVGLLLFLLTYWKIILMTIKDDQTGFEKLHRLQVMKHSWGSWEQQNCGFALLHSIFQALPACFPYIMEVHHSWCSVAL